MSMNASIFVHDDEAAPPVETRPLAGGPTVNIGVYPQQINLYFVTAVQARDFAAALVAAARDLDEWADTVDPDPIVSNYDAMTVGSPTLAPRHGKANCLAIGPDGHMCSRPAGHTGQHVAEGISTVQAVWPQDKLAESAERLIGMHEGAAS